MRTVCVTDCGCCLRLQAGSRHAVHLHSQSLLSGTYYIHTPAKAGLLDLHDPREISSAAGVRPRSPRRSWCHGMQWRGMIFG